MTREPGNPYRPEAVARYMDRSVADSAGPRTPRLRLALAALLAVLAAAAGLVASVRLPASTPALAVAARLPATAGGGWGWIVALPASDGARPPTGARVLVSVPASRRRAPARTVAPASGPISPQAFRARYGVLPNVAGSVPAAVWVAAARVPPGPAASHPSRFEGMALQARLESGTRGLVSLTSPSRR